MLVNSLSKAAPLLMGQVLLLLEVPWPCDTRGWFCPQPCSVRPLPLLPKPVAASNGQWQRHEHGEGGNSSNCLQQAPTSQGSSSSLKETCPCQGAEAGGVAEWKIYRCFKYMCKEKYPFMEFRGTLLHGYFLNHLHRDGTVIHHLLYLVIRIM